MKNREAFWGFHLEADAPVFIFPSYFKSNERAIIRPVSLQGTRRSRTVVAFTDNK